MHSTDRATENGAGRQLYELGPFRIDAERQTLTRDGQLIALTPKAFLLLVELVRHGGRVVTKDELMKAVWPDTFVEETNLTRNIFTLRKALGETELDRYIVTAPGQGYRMATAARLVPSPESSPVAAEPTPSIPVKRERSWRWAAVAAVLALALAGFLAWRVLKRRAPVLGEKDTIVLADFANSTGDAVFDGTLRQGMAVELGQSPYLSLVSEERIGRALALMGQPRDARLIPDLARQVCQRIGSAAVVDGSIARIGTQYVLGLHAANCHNGETLDDEQAQVTRKEDILNAVTQIAGRFRSRAGESVATIQQHATPLAEATTPSLEALKAYSAAWTVAFANPKDAIAHLHRAIEIDPEFAVAYAFQGRLYGDILEPVLSRQSATRAYELRSRASDGERFFIDLNYETQVTGDLEKAAEVARLWGQTYPREGVPHGVLPFIDQQMGQYDDSIADAKKTIELDPDFTPGYTNLAWAYVLSNRPAEAEKTLEQARARGLAMPEMVLLRYYIAFVNSDPQGMERAIQQGQGQAEVEDWLMYTQATALAYDGRMQQARTMTNSAVEMARHSSQPERAAMYKAGLAVREAFFGDGSRAQRDAREALALSDGRDVVWGAALAMALSGELRESEKMADDLEKRFPSDTLVRQNYLPVLRALAALHDQQPAKAIELLRTSSSDEMGIPGSWAGFFGNLYAPYVRGMAYMAQHRAAEAATEFRKVTDHREIVFTDPVGVLANLELARAYTLMGDRANAVSSYDRFLTSWKDADPDVTPLKQAKTEHQNLL